MNTYVPKSESSASDCMYAGQQRASDSDEDFGYSSVSDLSSANTSAASFETPDVQSLIEFIDENSDLCSYFKDISQDADDRSPETPLNLPEPPRRTFRNLPKLFVRSSESNSTNSKDYPCSVCDETFPTSAKLRDHMTTHSTNRRHVCKVCNKAFSQKTTLKTHMRVHTGERPYHCSMCPKSFADYSTCCKHERTHTGERPYACPICDRRFAQSGNMIRHKQTHTKKKVKD